MYFSACLVDFRLTPSLLSVKMGRIRNKQMLSYNPLQEELPMKRLAFIPLILAVAFGCASTHPAPIRDPIAMSVTEAKDIAADFESRQAAKADATALRAPKSLDEVIDILKLDQIDLFPAAAAFAAKQEGVKALALGAQVQLSWAESQILLSDAFYYLSRQFRNDLRTLEAKAATGDLNSADKETLSKLRGDVGMVNKYADALFLLAAEHAAEGAKLARLVIEKNPDDYHGYRAAADFYRMRQDWANFDEMVKKIEAIAPDNYGLLYLKGIAAAEREGNRDKAIEIFKKVLQKEPKFVRAQAQIYVLQDSIVGFYKEYVDLKKLNPNHQLVIWTGKFIENAWARREDMMRRLNDYKFTR